MAIELALEEKEISLVNSLWRGSQVVRHGSAKAVSAGRFRPSPPVKTPVNTGFSAGFGPEFHRNLHLFGCPFRILLLPGHSPSTARLRDGRPACHTHNHE